jgi:hypothetical protein
MTVPFRSSVIVMPERCAFLGFDCKHGQATGAPSMMLSLTRAVLPQLQSGELGLFSSVFQSLIHRFKVGLDSGIKPAL